MVVNKKSLIISALAAMLTLIGSVSYAANSDLLKMDIHKTEAADTVSVVFYTTGDKTNTVVTRKGNDKYVVLLPNVSGNSSVVPNLGGVKDYITAVDVRNINDGIGGYTKVTFTTTKPVNIQAFVKKTLPLTKAQLDYKDLIAKNNAKPALRTTSAEQPKQTVQSKTAAQPKTATQSKAATQTKTTAQPKAVAQPKTASEVIRSVATNPIFQKPASKTKIKITPNTTQNTNIQEPQKIVQQPKVQVVQTKPVEPKVSQVKPVSQKPVKEDILAQQTPVLPQEKPRQTVQDLDLTQAFALSNETKALENQASKELPEKTVVQPKTATNTQVKKTVKSKVNKAKSFAIGNLKNLSQKKKIGLGLLALMIMMFGILRKSSKKKNEYGPVNNQFAANTSTVNSGQYQDIIDNNELNWQEKYKLVSEQAKQKEQQNSYIATIPAKPVNSAFTNSVSDIQNHTGKTIKVDYGADIDSRGLLSGNFGYRTHGIQMKVSNREEYQKQRLQDTISQMGHSMGDYSVYEENSNDVISVDRSIMKHFEDVRQKVSKTQRVLKMSDRHKFKNKKSSFANSIKSDVIKQSGKLGLKKTKLTKERKNSNITSLHPDKMVTLKNEAEYMEKDYSQASLKEYLSILDMEEKIKSQAKPAPQKQEKIVYEVEKTTRATNPFNKITMPKALETVNSMKNMSIKSKYSIDKNKELCLVDMGGKSAIIGKINDDIRVLKKFDKEINVPLQVRHDDNNVYMVKAGKYKSLVDMNDSKMELLLEI